MSFAEASIPDRATLKYDVRTGGCLQPAILLQCIHIKAYTYAHRFQIWNRLDMQQLRLIHLHVLDTQQHIASRALHPPLGTTC